MLQTVTGTKKDKYKSINNNEACDSYKSARK